MNRKGMWRWTTRALVIVSMLLLAAPAAAADATTSEIERSPLCAFLASGLTDATGTVGATFTVVVGGTWGYLYGGETITFTPGSVPERDEAVLTLSVRTSGNGFEPVAVSAPGSASVTWTAPRMSLTGLRANVSTGNFQGMTWSCDARPPGPATAIDDLRGVVAGMDLAGGIEQALDSKLALAWEAAWADDVLGACGALTEFRDLVAAQDGKKLGTADAARLDAAAAAVEVDLICSG